MQQQWSVQLTGGCSCLFASCVIKALLNSMYLLLLANKYTTHQIHVSVCCHDMHSINWLWMGGCVFLPRLLCIMCHIAAATMWVWLRAALNV